MTAGGADASGGAEEQESMVGRVLLGDDVDGGPTAAVVDGDRRRMARATKLDGNPVHSGALLPIG